MTKNTKHAEEPSEWRGFGKAAYDGTVGFVGNAVPRLGNVALMASDAISGNERAEKDYFNNWISEYADDPDDPDTNTWGYTGGQIASMFIPSGGQIAAGIKGTTKVASWASKLAGAGKAAAKTAGTTAKAPLIKSGAGKAAATIAENAAKAPLTKSDVGKAVATIARNAAKAPLTKSGAASGVLNVALGAGERHSFDSDDVLKDYLEGAITAGATGGSKGKVATRKKDPLALQKKAVVEGLTREALKDALTSMGSEEKPAKAPAKEQETAAAEPFAEDRQDWFSSDDAIADEMTGTGKNRTPEQMRNQAAKARHGTSGKYYTGTAWGDNFAAGISSLAGGRDKFNAGQANFRALIEQGLDGDAAAMIAPNPQAVKETMQSLREEARLGAQHAGSQTVSPYYIRQLQAEGNLQSLLKDINQQAKIVYDVDEKGNPRRTAAGRAMQGLLANVPMPLPENLGEKYRRAPLALRQLLENYRIQYAAAVGGAGGRTTDAMHNTVAKSHVAPFQDYDAFKTWMHENMRDSRQRLLNAEVNKFSKSSLFGSGQGDQDPRDLIMNANSEIF